VLANWLPAAYDPIAIPVPDNTLARIPLDAPSALPDSIDGIDLAAGLVRLGQNAPLYHKLLLTFFREQHDTYADIEAAIKTNKLELAQKLIHHVEGVAGNLEMVALFDAAITLDNALLRGEVRLDLLACFRHCFEEIMQALAQLPDYQPATALSNEDNEEPDRETLMPLLLTLSVHLKNGSPRAADVLEASKQYFGHQLPERINQLERQIDTYCFKEASDTLNLIMDTLNATPH
jgi:two-component system sensor histidine kinase/response regulator